MKSFEQFPQGEEMPLVESGSRPGINQEVESHFDESYDAMLEALQASGDTMLGDLMRALPADRKQQLGAALNENGRDWKFLATLGKENSPAVAEQITAWRKSIDIVADAQAIRNANRFLLDSLEDL